MASIVVIRGCNCGRHETRFVAVYRLRKVRLQHQGAGCSTVEHGWLITCMASVMRGPSKASDALLLDHFPDRVPLLVAARSLVKSCVQSHHRTRRIIITQGGMVYISLSLLSVSLHPPRPVIALFSLTLSHFQRLSMALLDESPRLLSQYTSATINAETPTTSNRAR